MPTWEQMRDGIREIIVRRIPTLKQLDECSAEDFVEDLVYAVERADEDWAEAVRGLKARIVAEPDVPQKITDEELDSIVEEIMLAVR